MHRVASLLLVLLTACPAAKNEKKNEPVESCTAVGQSCNFAPGKLGLCVESVNGSPKFICQSQH